MRRLRIEAKREAAAKQVAPSGQNIYARDKQGRDWPISGSNTFFHRDRPSTSSYSAERPANKCIVFWDCGGNHNLRHFRYISDAEKKKNVYGDRMEKNGSKTRFCVFELSGRECDKLAVVDGIFKPPYKLDSEGFTSVVPRSLIDEIRSHDVVSGRSRYVCCGRDISLPERQHRDCCRTAQVKETQDSCRSCRDAWRCSLKMMFLLYSELILTSLEVYPEIDAFSWLVILKDEYCQYEKGIQGEDI